jgi:hypothetical protein
VFDSPPEAPFRYGGVEWARNGGCQCGCADLAACAGEGRAPAWGMGLVAQHTCRERVDRVPIWHQVRLAGPSNVVLAPTKHIFRVAFGRSLDSGGLER